MGCAPSQPDIAAIVKTGDLKQFSGTDNTVTLVIFDKDGRKTDPLILDKAWRNDFERGRTDVFKFTKISLGPITHIQLKKSGSDDWFCETVFIKNNVTDTLHTFPVCRWIRTEEPLTLQEHDCHLPDDSSDKVVRQRELDYKRTVYQLDVKEEGIPPQVKEVPQEEEFSDRYQSDLNKLAIKSVVDAGLNKLTSDCWKSLDDLKNVYGGIFTLPEAAKHDWPSDKYFGEQRVAAVNPLQIKLCTSLPENFPVTDEMVAPFLEDMKLQEALNQKRLFIEDLSFLDGVVCAHADKFKVCAPMGLFYKNKEDRLMPIAIQLYPTPGPENPIFLPSDPKYKWMLVKMWFNNADAQIHEASEHLALTHLMMGSICVSAHRQLSPSHPVFKLMAPHFLYLIRINGSALTTLLAEGGLIDRGMNMGITGSYEIIRRCLKDWKFGTHGCLQEELVARGVDNRQVLPHYPYRDDAVALYRAIKRYVTDVLTFYYGIATEIEAKVASLLDDHTRGAAEGYDTEESVSNDEEIQAWAKELSADVTEGGCGIQGVPGGGKFDNLEEIIAVVTNVITTCSVGHAAVNFNQYEQYGFPAAYPTLMHGDPPKDKEEITEDEIMKQLPNKSETVEIMGFSRLLSERATQSLGDFEIKYMYHPKAQEALSKLHMDLRKAGAEMKLFGGNRVFPYDILLPIYIPNAISI